MLDTFKQDFWRLSREGRGYYAWVKRCPHYVNWFSHRYRQFCPFHCDYSDSRVIVDDILANGLGIHPLLDTVFDAFARAESRFALRFVPQRSHEERLTGNLVSEIEAAVHLASSHFRSQAEERYHEPREVDFIYYDLSRGGKLESNTGADLAIILHVDLPDWPLLTRYAAFQAKKLNRSAQIDKNQCDALISQFKDAAAYLFYDMDFDTLAPPLVIEASEIKANDQKGTSSFSVRSDQVFGGLPLSLWMFSRLAREQTGAAEGSFKAAIDRFIQPRPDPVEVGGGRVAVLSVGRPLRITRDADAGLRIEV